MTSAAPSDLARERRLLATTTLADLFARDPDRSSRLSVEWDGWLLDLSKERLGEETLPLLVAHARESGLPGWIAPFSLLELAQRGRLLGHVASQSCDSNQRSASIAAWQPVPAAVTA